VRKATTAVEVLTPAEQLTIASVVRQASNLAGLSPWQRAQIEWRVKRQRGELIVQLAQLEADTVLAEAVMTSQGRIEEARERAALGIFETQLRCLLRAGALRDDAIVETMRLAEGSREVIAGAIDRVTTSFLLSVERRAGRE